MNTASLNNLAFDTRT